LLEASIVKVLASKFNAFTTLAKVKVDAAPAVIFKAPAEVTAKVPEVVVDKVRLALVVPMVEAPSPVAEMAPEVAVRLRAPVVIVNPLEAVSAVENLPLPVTSKVTPGLVSPTPTLLLEASIVKVLASKFNAFTTLARVKVEAAPAVIFKAPAEVTAKVPEVVVLRVKLLEALVMVETPSSWDSTAMEFPEISISLPSV
jgi:hypothetical protein